MIQRCMSAEIRVHVPLFIVGGDDEICRRTSVKIEYNPHRMPGRFPTDNRPGYMEVNAILRR